MAYSDVVASIAVVISICAAVFSFVQSRQSKRQADAAHRDIEPTFYILSDEKDPQDLLLVVQNHNRRDLRIIGMRAKVPVEFTVGLRHIDSTIDALRERFKGTDDETISVDLGRASRLIPGSPIGGPETSRAEIELTLARATPAPFEGGFELVAWIDHELLGDRSGTQTAKIICKIPTVPVPLKQRSLSELFDPRAS